MKEGIDSHAQSLPPIQQYSLQVESLNIEAPFVWTNSFNSYLPKLFSKKDSNSTKSTSSSTLEAEEKGKGKAFVGKELVNDVNLVVNPGELTVIVGGSGSGKTTLLNCIAGRVGNLVISSGSVSFLPYQLSPNQSSNSKIKRGKIGFVRQEDNLLPYLTVRETLSFAAALRLPKSLSSETREEIVEKTLIELGLKDVENVLVGGPFRKGISGGEKRRLSIGCILVTLPSVLILDEITTGLDSFTSFQLLETLSRLAKRGRVVVLSIHQPRSDCFPLFDKVLLLSRGNVIFSGLGAQILPYFKSQGFEPVPNTNPLDFIVDVSSVDTRNDAAETSTRERVGKLVLAWKETELNVQKNTKETDEITLSPSLSTSSSAPNIEKLAQVDSTPSEKVEVSSSEEGETEDSQLARPNYFAQTKLLTRRGWLNVRRNYGQQIGFLLQALIIGIVIGLSFFNPPETPSGIQSLKTVIYMSTPGFFYLSIIVYVFILTSELVVFDREREDNLYGTLPAVVGNWLSYLPSNVVFPTIYAIIIYFMCGLWRENLAVNLLSFIAQCILQQLSAFAFALLGASIDRSFATASLLCNGFSIPFILSSGYLIVHLPIWISWTRWFSPYFYGFHWIARTQLVGREFVCEGVVGPARNACSGTKVLVGLEFPLDTPLLVYPLGLLGFVIALQLIATLILQFYHPGGIKHAAQISSDGEKIRGAEAKEVGLIEKQERVDIVIAGLGLTVSKRSLLSRKMKEEKVILSNVDGCFAAGKVNAIMGPSGSGKSSLLQLLSGRLATGGTSNFNSTGTILLNGKPFDPTTMSSLLAFVEQEDSRHLPALTVRETLYYAAALRIRGKSKKETDARAEELIKMLGLKLCADNLVGGELVKGISGGEKRRLSLAVQMLSDPAVLLADEPLSGLDAFTAQNVMNTLKEIATSGRTVIVSVHQPRSDIWNLFDNVLLLVKGGHTAYSGVRKDILEFFASDSLGLRCPKTFNPADFVLDVCSIDHSSLEKEGISSLRVSKILSSWNGQKNTSLVTISSNDESLVGSVGQTNAPFWKAFFVVITRSFKNMRRQQDVFVARLINPPFLALLFWLFFARLDLSPASAQTRVGVLQELSAMPFVGMLANVAIFPVEKRLFYYEYKSSARYSVGTFLLAYSVQEVFVSIVGSLLFSIIMVYGIGLQSTSRIFVEFWMSTFCLLSTGESIGIAFSAFSENGGLSVSLVSAAITLLSQLNGIISVTLPYWLEIIGWISPMKTQSRIQIINEFKGLVFNCTPEDITSGACITATGEQLLATFNIAADGTGKYMGILFALILLFRFVAYLALRVKVSML